MVSSMSLLENSKDRVKLYMAAGGTMSSKAGFVHIIESPSDSDLLNDWTEGKVLRQALRLANIPHRYYLATSLKTFEECLRVRLGQAVTQVQKPPILHLSMHGDSEGIELTNKEFLRWENLRRLLAPITDAMQGDLLICISSCFGGSGCQMAMHEDKEHPFGTLIGNTDKATLSDIAVAFTVFYHLLFKGTELEECVERMKSASGNDNFTKFSGPAVKAAWTALMEKRRFDDLMARLQTFAPANPWALAGPSGQQPTGWAFSSKLSRVNAPTWKL